MNFEITSASNTISENKMVPTNTIRVALSNSGQLDQVTLCTSSL